MAWIVGTPRLYGRLGRVAQALATCTILASAGVLAQGGPGGQSGQHLPTVWDLQLGEHARELPLGDFTDYACGTNGGPPSRQLGGWVDFAQCAPEAGSDLHEVYFEYDDEQEYRGRARHLDLQVMRNQYTWVNGVPVIASGLFDADGFLMGLRLVTDPRIDVTMRDKGMTLGGFMFARYGEEGWSCSDLPREPGESAYKDKFIKRSCTKQVTIEGGGAVDLTVEVHNYRREGQGALSYENLPTEGEFESSTRFEARLASPIPDRAIQLARITELGPIPPDAVVLRAMNCAGCDLRGVNLKRADLRGAKLAGADLSGANLHAARLDGADLTGTNLSGANLNRAELRGADLQKANLQKVMLFGSSLDGADLSDADLTGALASSVRLTRANLSGAMLWAADLRDGRLNGANLSGANLNAAWLHSAQLNRANFSNAILIYVLAHNADLQGADLTGVDARGADFFGSNLRESDLTAADFSFTRLTQVNLFSATFKDTKFEEAELPAGFTPP